MKKFKIYWVHESGISDECHGIDVRFKETIYEAESKEDAEELWYAQPHKRAYIERTVEIGGV